MRVAMIGAGYVGLVSGACFADFGHNVTCVDKDADKIARAEARRDADLRAGPRRAGGGQRRSEGGCPSPPTWPAPSRDADAVFIAVGTPSRRGDGHADLTYVYAGGARDRRRCSTATRWSSPNRRCRSAPATRSSASSREARPDAEFAVVSNPEFLREGAAISDFKRPDRIVVGTDDERAREVMTRALPAALSQRDADPVHRPAHVGADQVRRQRLPGDEDHLHQRDRRPVREGRRRRAGGRARHRPRQPHRPQVPATPARATAARAFPRTRWR